MMNATELDSTLSALGLDLEEAATLLSSAPRTLRRWREEGVPGAAEAALRAWLTLNDWGIPWRPDTVSIAEADKDQIRRMREHALEIDEMLKRVAARGGPKPLWAVDFARHVALFDRFRVSFYELANGGFSLSHYTRTDRKPDARRDAAIIEDAAYSIAAAYRRAQAQSDAIRAVADYTRTNARFYAREGARMHTPDERAQNVAKIETVAAEMNGLAERPGRGRVTYSDFEALMLKLHGLGFFPESDLIAAVAGAFHGADSNT